MLTASIRHTTIRRWTAATTTCWKVRKDMANYKTGPDGFSVQAFARYGNDPTTL